MTLTRRPSRPGEGRPRTTILRTRTRTFLHAYTATSDLEHARSASGLTEAQAWRIVAPLGAEGLAALTDAGDIEAQAA